jgi:hypothetical protein
VKEIGLGLTEPVGGAARHIAQDSRRGEQTGKDQKSEMREPSARTAAG